ncbi:zona pellucida sperm-binding protein 3-like [Acanthochromis polyacanthus]|uniref:zona pellucida sperm-binding protein 3-like n=1 Tax=Acanthochromis polyacanthus TaxID=80966 RepID=UPI002233FC94|nr:zona pellucida sperm-binding protein 3-like [Acanthochromis polyacanthus]
MAFFWCCALLLGLVAASLVNADMKVDCRPDYMTVVWSDSRSQADTSLFRLGTCVPTSVSAREAVFSVRLDDCNFRTLVTGDHQMYTNDLVYYSPPNSLMPSFSLPVVCAYERPKDWTIRIFDPVFDTYGQDDLVFFIGIMNDDFSGPAETTSFSLGSFIRIMASVEQQHHQPLLMLLDECIATTSPELQHEVALYPIIANKGCLVDSKTSLSRFEPRVKSSEIHLSLQAFRFALGEEVFIHCNLLAWDPNALDHTKKACNYVKAHGWELLDHPTYSSICACCESSCKSRKTRSLTSGKRGVEHKAVLGPITIKDS